MSRRQTRFNPRVQADGGEQPGRFGFQQVAPITAAAGSSRGQSLAGLADFLGVGAEFYAAQRARQEADDFADGERDARLGAVDQDRVDGSRAYARATLQVATEARLLDDEEAIRNDEDLKALTAAGDVDGIREFLAERLSPWAEAPTEEEREMITRWSHRLESDLVSQAQTVGRITADAENYADGLRTFQGEYNAAQQEGRAIDYAKLHRTARDLYGKDANAFMTNVLTRLALDNADPSIIDALPDSWTDSITGQQIPGLMNTNEYGEKLRAVRDQATDARRAINQQEQQQRKSRTLFDFNQRIEDGDYFSEKEVWEHVHRDDGTGTLTATEAQSLLNAQARAMAERARASQIAFDLRERFAVGRGDWWEAADFHDLSRSEVQSQYNAYMDEEVHTVANAAIASGADPVAAVARFVVDSTIRNDLIHEGYAQNLNSLDPSNVERFASQVEMFRHLRAADPNAAAKYVSNEDVHARYSAAITLMDRAGWGPEAVANAMRTVDPKEATSRYIDGGVQQAVNEYIDGARFLRPDGIFRRLAPKVSNLAPGFQAYARAEARRLADAVAATGLYTDAESLMSAVDDIMGSRLMTLRTGGGNLLVPRTEDAPVDVEDAFDWYMRHGLQESIDAIGLPLSSDDIALVPDMRTVNDRASFRLVHKDTWEPLMVDGEDARVSFDSVHGLWRERRPDIIREQHRQRLERSQEAAISIVPRPTEMSLTP